MLLILGTATVFVLKRELNFSVVMQIIQNVNVWLLLPALFCMAAYFYLMAANIRNGLSVFGEGKSISKSILYTVAGFFFSGITPSSSGGQPAQLFYMNRDGVKLSHGTFALLLELLSFVSATVILGIIGAVAFFCEGGQLVGVLWLYVLGFVINFAAIALIYCFMFSKNAAKIITGWILAASRKFFPKKKNDYRILRSVAEYRKAAKYLKKDGKLFVRMLLTSLLQLTLYHSIPFFCCISLGTRHIGWFRAMSRQAMLYASVSSLPFPGAAGVTEGGYALMFASMMSEGMLGTTMILSRIIGFVLPLLVSGIWLLISSRIFQKNEKNNHRFD